MAANNEDRLNNFQANIKTDSKIKFQVTKTLRKIHQQNKDIIGLNLIPVDQFVTASLTLN